MASPSALVGLTVLVLLSAVALLAPTLAPHDPFEQNLQNALEAPSPHHWLGTDEFGRDLLSRMMHGARISLTVGVLVVLLGGTVGIALGLVAGYFEGWLDQAVSRVIEVQLAFPGLLLAMVVVAVLGPTLTNAMIAVAVETIPGFVRITRGAVLSQKHTDFVQAAQTIGASQLRVILRHVLPNVFAPILVLGTLGVGSALLAASSLSFLGLGAQPPAAEWGAILTTGRAYIRRSAVLTLAPGFAIMVTVLAINLLGDGLRDALDPTVRVRGKNR